MKKAISLKEKDSVYTETKNTGIYQAPDIEQIKLDNDISLILESGSPASPGGDPWAKADEANVNNPFKTELG